MSGVVPHPAMQPGQLIAGKFRLIRELGQGGMGAVWSAVHETLGREVAVKFLSPLQNQSPSLTERFVSEARMVASIKHRFVVDVFDFGVGDDGLYYMVLELLQGTTLAQRIDHGPAFAVRAAVQLMADCLRGLQVVHEAGIVHRDLKPDNIFVIEDAEGAFPKLIDFGISKRTDEGPLPQLGKPGSRKSRLTLPGTVVGTPYYMSPEQLRGRHDLDRRADVYSVGVILFELLTGRLPFDQDNVGDLMVAITIEGAPRLSQLRPELGQELSAVIDCALAPDRDDRFASAAELRDALLSVLPLLPPSALSVVQQSENSGPTTHLQLQAPKSPLPPGLAPAPRRVSWPGLLFAGAGLFSIALLLWLFFKPDAEPTVIPLGVLPEQAPQAANVILPEPIVPAAQSGGGGPRPEGVDSADLKREAKRARASVPAPAKASAADRPPANPYADPATLPNKPQKLYRKLDF